MSALLGVVFIYTCAQGLWAAAAHYWKKLTT